MDSEGTRQTPFYHRIAANTRRCIVNMTNLKPSVRLGNRVYDTGTWKRKDTVYLGKKKIGYIRLTHENRIGFTISALNGLITPGRAVVWCVEQFAMNEGLI